MKKLKTKYRFIRDVVQIHQKPSQKPATYSPGGELASYSATRLRKNISAFAENLGILYASGIGSADGKKSINIFYWFYGSICTL